MTSTTSNNYLPKFKAHFLQPKHWGSWFTILLLGLVALLPWRIRDKVAGWLGVKVGHFAKKARSRSLVNLQLCFPDMTSEEHQHLIDRNFAVAAQVMLAMGELTLRSRRHLEERTVVFGKEYLDAAIESKKNTIILVPHCWAIDYPAIYWASQNIPMVGLIKPQHRQPVMDWFMSRQRLQYGGRCHPRSAGIKPYIRSIKEGYLGYYLPDEDFGREQSHFSPFFATEKATFNGLGKIARITNAAVLPMLPIYNSENGKFEIHIYPELDTIGTGSSQQDANTLSSNLESLISKHPEQYMWILKLLETRPEGGRPYFEMEKKMGLRK